MLAAADRALNDPTDRFATAFVGVIDPRTLTLSYHSAGHPPPLLRRPDATLSELERGGPPLGLYAGNEPSPAHTLTLLPGSLLVLYTDGLTESTRNMLAGEERLRVALADAATAAAAHPAQYLHDRVLADGSHDDVAVLTVRVL
jgi:serine phosphatase RsbU (regulator of sigma subunit)